MKSEKCVPLSSLVPYIYYKAVKVQDGLKSNLIGFQPEPSLKDILVITEIKFILHLIGRQVLGKQIKLC